jgi:hypothetical protein
MIALSELWALIQCKWQFRQIRRNIKKIKNIFHPLLNINDAFSNLPSENKSWYMNQLGKLRRQVKEHIDPTPKYILGTASRLVKNSRLWNDDTGGCDGYGCLCDDTSH